jgi:hypothetical protein
VTQLYPSLEEFIAAYFHQDWRLDHQDAAALAVTLK